jgi:hypothetical protein
MCYHKMSEFMVNSLARTNLFKKLLYPTQRLAAYVKVVAWEMEFNRLMNQCRDTGGESSPYFDKLQEHLKNDPKRKTT